MVERSAKGRHRLRCAIYTRKSSEEGLEQQFNSLDAQREACEAFIASQRHEGWTLLRDRYDGLSRARLKRLRELAENPEGREPPPDPAASLRPGAKLVREWHGRTHVVVVTDRGFDYSGSSYRSLTQVAKLITGAHWSGPRFFGLTNGQPTRECADG